MAKVYAEQIEELNKILPEFKVASTVVHFEEKSKSQHMHIVGIPVKEDCKRGMKKQVGKSQIFTKSSLTKIQDKMRIACIKSYNKIAFDKDEQYKYVSEDLHKAGIFSDDEFEIATNAFRKVKPKEEVAEKEQKKEKSDKCTIKR